MLIFFVQVFFLELVRESHIKTFFYSLSAFVNQANPNALVLGGVDQALENKNRRREKREAAAAAQRQKEQERVARVVVASKNSGYQSEGEAEEGDSDETINDPTYKASWEGHERKRSKRIKLEIDVKQLQESFSDQADHYIMSSNARCSIFSDFVSGGGSLKDVPCSQSTMRRYPCCDSLFVGLSICKLIIFTKNRKTESKQAKERASEQVSEQTNEQTSKRTSNRASGQTN